MNGFIHFIYPERSVSLDDVRVDDGEWHFLETRWLVSGKLVLLLDYDQIQKVESIGSWINGKSISRVYIGGMLQTIGSTPLVINGLKGCVKVGGGNVNLVASYSKSVLYKCALKTDMLFEKKKICLGGGSKS